jgi:1-aminocyclopropane-1-carboxylate deaminase
MPKLTGEKYEKWNHFSQGPLQSLSGWHSREQLSILRLDLLQSWASGNKYYKLKYAIEFALANGVKAIVSKGGMFSNHLAALADACVVFELDLISVIRSFAPDESNPSIRKLRKNGSQILYVKPEDYNAFDEEEAKRLFPGSMFIPEGGLSNLGIRGTSEILTERFEHNPTHIIVSGGSLGTACGIISSAPADVKVIIVPAWKGCGESYVDEILRQYHIAHTCSWDVWSEYHFGGFGRFNQQLIDFMVSFAADTGIPLDPVYTGKLMYAINDRFENSYFKETDSIIAIHTGGLQGLEGYRYRFPKVWGSYPAYGWEYKIV